MTLKTLAATIAMTMLTALLAGAARADDTEIFFNQASSNVGANVLLVLDTSGSMDDEVTSVNPYDGTVTYPGSCSSSYYYFVKPATPPAVTPAPTCSTTNRVPVANFKCASATSQMATGVGADNATGSFSDTFIRWGKVTTKKGSVTTTVYQWTGNLAVGSGSDVECVTDAGVEGNGDPAYLYPTKKTDPASATGIWGINTDSWWSVSGNQGSSVTFYNANYINYLNDPAQTLIQSKIKIMQDAVKALLGSVQNVNVGLMRYDVNGNGGMVTTAVGPVASAGPAISTAVNSWAAAGSTPLTKTLYEAYEYYAQKAVVYGVNSTSTRCLTTAVNARGATHCTSYNRVAFPSVAASRTGGSASSKNYDSPADLTCQKNYLIFLTDGQSNNTDTAINATLKSTLPNFNTLGGACDATVPPGANGGQCFGALAQYMQNADLRTDIAQTQNVTSYFIGFGDTFKTDVNAAAYYDYLNKAAKRGGSDHAFTATTLSELSLVFNQIFNEVQNINTSFSAPAVAVNAFNRTQTLDDLYVSVFTPRSTYHWPGNVKKYKVTNGAIVDANGDAAVDSSTGFFKKLAQSFWSASPDGPDVTKGGAASNLPDYSTRTLYTFLGGNPSSPPVAVVGIGATPDAVLGASATSSPSRVDLINWAKGQDVQDNINGVSNNITDENRFEMGDPIHTQPAVVIYGTGQDDTVLYTPTNDGYLHAINGRTGVEKWAFIPQQMLSKLKLLYADDDTAGKNYALDGQITLIKYDVNGDGVVDANAGDKVLLYFGTGRNADVQGYYALDVTNPDSPQFQWFIDSSVLPDLGQAWSTPTVARVNINGATQNSQKLVLVIGGGYDPVEDGYSFVPADSVGNHIYMVDALKGTLLWSAGSSGSSKLQLTRMTHSIPSPVTVLDTNGDGYADRMYVGDMAGQVWRFDIFNGQNDSNLVTGGVMASLGSKDESPHTAANTRRFYSGPDVAAIQVNGAPTFLNIAIGSGYRGHPLDSGTVDRLYSLRDYNPFVQLTQTAYNTLMNSTNLVLDSTLVDITSSNAIVVPNTPGTKGWKLVLNTHSIGEKALVPARTFNDQIFFTTYTPNLAVSADPCAAVGSGINRSYVISVFNGAAVFDQNKTGTLTTDDRSQDLSQGGIAPETTFLFPAEDGVNSDGSQSGGETGGSKGPVICLKGVEVLSACTNYDRRKKTYWREGTAQ